MRQCVYALIAFRYVAFLMVSCLQSLSEGCGVDDNKNKLTDHRVATVLVPCITLVCVRMQSRNIDTLSELDAGCTLLIALRKATIVDIE
jgi:hypothetical protein